MGWQSYKKSGYMVISLTALLLLAACGENEANPAGSVVEQTPVETSKAVEASPAEKSTRTVTDQFGKVEIPTNPKRVSALYREDYLVALDVKPVVQYYNPMFGKQDYLKLEVPLFDISGSIEAMLASAPDLIIAAGDVDAAKYELFSKVAPTFRLPDDVLSDSRKTLTMMADILGIPDKAEQVLKEYDTRIAEVKAKLKNAMNGESLIVLRMNVADKSINIFGFNNSFVGQILYKDLELEAPAYAKSMTEGNIVLSNEVIPELGADHIILLPSNGTWEDEGNANALKEMLASPLWKSVPAIKNNHVYPVERSYWQTGAITANYRKMDELLKLLASQ